MLCGVCVELSVVWMVGSAELRAGLDESAAADAVAADTATSASSAASSSPSSSSSSSSVLLACEFDSVGVSTPMEIRFAPADGKKCPRCWLLSTHINEKQHCCNRCNSIMQQRNTGTSQL